MHKAPTRNASAPVADKLPLLGSNLRNSPKITIAWKYWIVVLKANVAGTKACTGSRGAPRRLRYKSVRPNTAMAKASSPNAKRESGTFGASKKPISVLKTFSKEKASAVASGSVTPRSPNPGRAVKLPCGSLSMTCSTTSRVRSTIAPHAKYNPTSASNRPRLAEGASFELFERCPKQRQSAVPTAQTMTPDARL